LLWWRSSRFCEFTADIACISAATNVIQTLCNPYKCLRLQAGRGQPGRRCVWSQTGGGSSGSSSSGVTAAAAAVAAFCSSSSSSSSTNSKFNSSIGNGDSSSGGGSGAGTSSCRGGYGGKPTTVAAARWGDLKMEEGRMKIIEWNKLKNED